MFAPARRRWILQKDVPINTMSTKPAHIRKNFEIMDFALSGIDMAKIDAPCAVNFRLVTKEKTPSLPNGTELLACGYFLMLRGAAADAAPMCS